VTNVKILIAGAAGQLGRCLLHSLAAHELVPLDRYALDVTQLERVRDAVEHHRPDLVINGSAFNDVDGAESQAAEAYAVNALGPRNLAIATAMRGIALAHLSTDYVFDGAIERPYHEFDRPNPLSVYGASKLAGEEAVRTFNHRHYIIRTAWLYWESGRNFLLSMYWKASKPELRVIFDQCGSPTYVPHLAWGLAQLVTSEAYGTYHIAGGGSATRWDLVTELFRTLKITTPVHPVASRAFPAPAKRPAFSVLTTAQTPRIELPPWQEGVSEFARQIG
jgi:dTDP-4-dehydrorhamnose reductase